MHFLDANVLIMGNMDENLMQLLDAGIDDMESGNELSVDDAFQRIDEIRTRQSHGDII